MPKKIIVVGGGIAGLTAAYTLQKHGFDVEVLERNDDGRRPHAQRAPRRLRRRPRRAVRRQQLPQHARARRRARPEAAGAAPARPAAARRSATASSSAATTPASGDLRTRRTSAWPASCACRCILNELRRARALLDFYAIEKRRAARRRVRPRLGAAPLRPRGARLPDRAAVRVDVHRAAREPLARVRARDDQLHVRPASASAPSHGGNGLLTQTLASKLRVRTGVEVARIAQSADGAIVTLASGETLAADAVVIATPGNHVARLCDTLTAGERRFFDGVRYASSIIVFVMTSTTEADPGVYGLGIGRPEGVRLYGMAMENPKEGAVPPGKTMFNCAFSEEYAAELMSQARQRRHRSRCTASCASCRSAASTRPRATPSTAGRSSCRSSTPATSARSPRSSSAPIAATALFFAGDYLVGPYTEAALTSGLRAADDIRARFAPCADRRNDADGDRGALAAGRLDRLAPRRLCLPRHMAARTAPSRKRGNACSSSASSPAPSSA